MKEEVNVYCAKIEDFDYVIYDWINEDLNIFADTQTGWRKVPVVFASPESFVFSKESPDTRDQNGTLNYPIISIEKKTVSKPNQHDGNMAVNQWGAPRPGGAVEVAQKLSQYTNSKFMNRNSYNNTGLNNRKHKDKNNVYQIISIPQPSFIEISYEITIVANFHQQLNQIMSPFITKYGNINYFSKERNGWSYELFIEEQFSQESNVADFSAEERLFKSKMQIKVKGYILEKENSDTTNVSIKETTIEFKFKKEYVLKGSIDEYIANPSKFKINFETNPIVIFDAKIDDFNNASNVIPITMAISGSTLYLGGSFTYINGEKRNRLAAINKYTGKLLSFNPDITVTSGICNINAIALSGTNMYVGGRFSSVSGVARNNLASFNTETGQLQPWNPDANNLINSISIYGDDVFVAGSFTAVSGSTRNRIASVNKTTGALQSANPNMSGLVLAGIIDGSTYYVGGTFTTAGGITRNRLAAFSLPSFSLASWDPNASVSARPLLASGSYIYVGGFYTTLGSPSVQTISIANGGSGYNIGNILTLVGGNNNALIQVLSVAPITNAVTNAVLVSAGTGYSVGIVNTTGSPGNGCQINITSVTSTSVKTICQTDKTTGVANIINTYTSGNGSRNAILYGNNVFIVGDFSYSNAGKTRSNFAAFNSTTMQLDNTYKYDSDFQIYNILIDEGSIYLCGGFSTINGQARYGIFKGTIS
jgi:hypothetical protein